MAENKNYIHAMVNDYRILVDRDCNVTISQEAPIGCPGPIQVFMTPDQIPLLIKHLERVMEHINNTLGAKSA